MKGRLKELTIPGENLSLSSYRSPPWWIGKIPILNSAWINPIFQRKYRTYNPRPMTGPFPPLLIGFFCSFLISYGILGWGKNVPFYRIEDSGLYSVIIPTTLIGFVTFVRLLAPAMIISPLMVQSIFSRQTYGTMMVPIQEKNLFATASLAPVLCSHRVIEESVRLMLGTILGHVLYLSISTYFFQAIADQYTVFWEIWMNPMIIGLVLYLIAIFHIAPFLIAAATSAHSIENPILVSDIFGLIRVFVQFIISSIIAYVMAVFSFLLIDLIPFAYVDTFGLYLMVFIGGLFHLLSLFIALELTLNAGAARIARLRRDGK